MARFIIQIPDGKVARVEAALGKEGVPIERRLARAIIQSMGQKELNDFTTVAEQEFGVAEEARKRDHVAAMQRRATELEAELELGGE